MFTVLRKQCDTRLTYAIAAIHPVILNSLHVQLQFRIRTNDLQCVIQCKYHMLQCVKLLMFSLVIKIGKCVQLKSSKRVVCLVLCLRCTTIYARPFRVCPCRSCPFCDQICQTAAMGLSVPFSIGLILADLHILYATKQNKNHYHQTRFLGLK